MPKFWSTLLRKSNPNGDKRYSLDEWMEDMSFGFNGTTYPIYGQSPGLGSSVETIETNFLGYINALYKSDGIVYACMQARASVFSEVRFVFQELEEGSGRPGKVTVPPRLSILQKPWPNGSTGDLLIRAIQDADLAGNHYVVRENGRLRRLRPDWVEIILSAPPDEAVQSDVVGYKYTPGGPAGHAPGGAKKPSRLYLPEEIAHWTGLTPDPEAQYRGMSWLTPIIREVQSDKGATQHKLKFFENAATPHLSVSLNETVTEEQFRKFMKTMNDAHGGVDSAYKTLFLGGGADVQVIGANLRQMDFKATQGAGETRIAAAAQVHPVIVGLSEGMQGASLNAGNFKVAKDAFADRTLRPMWRSICSAYESLVRVPEGSRLWYDDRDIPFLRMDHTERAQTQQREASIIRSLTDGGWKPESIIDAIVSDDWKKMEHTGLVSVQLVPPGGAPSSGAIPGTPGAPVGAGAQGGKGNAPEGSKQPGKRIPPKGAGNPQQPGIGVSTPKEGAG